MNEFAEAILKSMAARHLSREELAHRSKVSLSSLHKILAGSRNPSFAQRVRLEEALGLTLQTQPPAVPTVVAPDEFGAYARAAVRWMEGIYLAVRHSFNHTDTIIAYAVVFEWDDTAAVLSFVTRDDFTGPALQQGRVSFSTRTGHSYLLTNDFGRFDLTVLGRPIEDGRLLGLCTTAFMHQRRPTPASSDIALMPVCLDVENLPKCGPVTVGDAAFADYSEWLRSAERDGFARIVGSSLSQPSNPASAEDN